MRKINAHVLTTAHDRFDTRIFHKEIKSLAQKHNVELTLHVCDGLGDTYLDQLKLKIVDHGRKRFRWQRMLVSSAQIAVSVIKMKAQVVHFHDPEFLPFASILRFFGITIIYDVHENLAATILDKPYITPKYRWIISVIVRYLEKFFCLFVNGIICATPDIARIFPDKKSCVVQNFPNHSLSLSVHEDRKDYFVFAGMITELRGLTTVIDALDLVKSDAQLFLIGPFQDAAYKQSLEKKPGWSRVHYIPWLEREELFQTIRKSLGGVVTFTAAANHVTAQPNKMFEYMSCGTPVIGSNFPLWREIVIDNEVGFLVDPSNANDIAQIFDKLFYDRELVQSLGQNGIDSVINKFSWQSEELKLLNFYACLEGEGNE